MQHVTYKVLWRGNLCSPRMPYHDFESFTVYRWDTCKRKASAHVAFRSRVHIVVVIECTYPLSDSQRGHAVCDVEERNNKPTGKPPTISCSPSNVRTGRHIIHQCVQQHFSLMYCKQCRTAKCWPCHMDKKRNGNVREPESWRAFIFIGLRMKTLVRLLKMNEQLFGADSCKCTLPRWVWKKLSPSPTYSWLLYELRLFPPPSNASEWFGPLPNYIRPSATLFLQSD